LIETVAVTGSTNADLLVGLAAGEPVGDGFWRVALRQTAGRGRLGRAWSDGLGNFMGSTAVHLAPGDPPAGSLALVAGLAVIEAIRPFVPAPRKAMLKWPNDVLVDGAKLAGILLERQGDTVVVGVGVNLAQAPQVPGRATCALADFAPAPVVQAFAQTLAAGFAGQLALWRLHGLAPLIARWQASAHPMGTALTVTDPGLGPVMGRFAGLDEQGALRLALADGTTRIVHAGDVHLA
jgi:BirA family transcriptional regulator, biotin operon repressor / biotin---[acetyl-CoA-carboxylase] ligase